MSIEGSLARSNRIGEWESLLAVGILRAVLIPIVAAGSAISDAATMPGFAPLVALAGGYAVAQLLTLRLREQPRWLRATSPVVDVVLLIALAHLSGGSASDVRKAFVLLPLAAAFVTGPTRVCGWGMVAVAAYFVVSLLDAETATADAAVHALYLAWASAAAVVLSIVLDRRARRIVELATERGLLVDRALGAAAEERQRLAEALHDAPIQNLLAARMELAEVRHVDPDTLDRVQQAIDSTVTELREAVFELHPQVLESAGLEAALGAVARQQARLGGFEVSLDIAQELTHARDPLLYAFTRELLINAARHANAEHVAVNMFTEDGNIVVEVIDDGQGMSSDRPQRAQEEGHIGLAATAERARARGGRLRLRSTPGGGTRVRVALPTVDSDLGPVGDTR